jgi:hypothetical protein
MFGAYIYILGSLAARKEAQLIRTINPEFKDLAQTWGWKGMEDDYSA